MRDKILAALLMVSCGEVEFKNDGDACEGISGSCLSLRVAGTGTIDSLSVRAIVQGSTLKMGDSTGCPLPCVYRVRPPAGISSTMITGMSFIVTRGGKSFKQDLVFPWSEGAHVSQQITPIF